MYFVWEVVLECVVVELEFIGVWDEMDVDDGFFVVVDDGSVRGGSYWVICLILNGWGFCVVCGCFGLV